jgi:8-amino-7-oxononanoate synthase
MSAGPKITIDKPFGAKRLFRGNPGDRGSDPRASLEHTKTQGAEPVVSLVAESAGSCPAPDPLNQVIDGFAGYRKLKRRIADVSRQGIDIPFFQPRDGVSASTVRLGNRELINYSGYNYLGLSGHPAVSRAAKAAIDVYGTSASASRIVAGQIELHGALERRIADFLGAEDCIVFVSGYLTNVTVIGHLFSKPDLVVYDSMVHNSIITGTRLSEATVLGHSRNAWDELDRALAPIRANFRRGLLVGEGVFSMDGGILDLAGALALKRKHGLMLMVDEAHSLGVLGKTGRGLAEHAGLPAREIDIQMGTLSKTLASCGGYIAGNRSLIEYLRFLAPGFIFSVGLSPPDTAAALAALDILDREPERPLQLRERVHAFRRLARDYGLPVEGFEDSAIVSLVVGDTKRSMLLSQRLLEHGIHVQPIVYPAVAKDCARLRFFITTNHTEEQFRATIPTLARELECLGPAGD